MNSQPGLTLAVIVKNEAELLAGLLHHHRDLYDAAVVVDTGSTDNSKEVAVKAGAKVLQHQWADDFSAARNQGLDAITTPWVLQMDCDERLDPSSFMELKEIVKGPADFCLELPINNYTSTAKGGEWSEIQPENQPWCENAVGYMRTCPVRLFPNLPNLRFQGVVHENLLSGIENFGLKIVRGTQLIHHTGLLNAEGRDRREILYTRLLQKKVSQVPNDLNALAEYSRILVSKGELAKAETLLLHGLSNENKMGLNPHANLLLIEIQARLGKLDLALERIGPTIHQHPNHLLCWVQASALHIATGQPQKAKIYLEQGLKLFPTSAVLRQLEAKV